MPGQYPDSWNFPVRLISAPPSNGLVYVSPQDYEISVATETAGEVAVILPFTQSTKPGSTFRISKGAGAAVVRVRGVDGALINGIAEIVLSNPHESHQFRWDGIRWRSIGAQGPQGPSGPKGIDATTTGAAYINVTDLASPYVLSEAEQSAPLLVLTGTPLGSKVLRYNPPGVGTALRRSIRNSSTQQMIMTLNPSTGISFPVYPAPDTQNLNNVVELTIEQSGVYGPPVMGFGRDSSSLTINQNITNNLSQVLSSNFALFLQVNGTGAGTRTVRFYKLFSAGYTSPAVLRSVFNNTPANLNVGAHDNGSVIGADIIIPPAKTGFIVQLNSGIRFAHDIIA